MMKKLAALLILIATMSSVWAQTPVVTWENTIGGNWGDGCNDVVPTADGGFLLGGGSASDLFGDKTEANIGEGDIWLVKINSQGVVQWDEAIGGTGNENLISLDTTSDGGFILGSHSLSGISGDKTEGNLGDYDFWVIKTDSLANIEWQNTIGGSAGEQLKKVYQTTDGGYVVAGSSSSGISGDKTETNYGDNDIWVLKLNNTGSIVWQNTIGGNDTDYLNDAKAGPNGSIYLAGNSRSNIGVDKTENLIGGTSDYWVIKLDAVGQIVWQNTIGGSDADNLNDLVVHSDGSALLIGTSRSNISGDKTENNIGDNDYWLVKLDNQGVVEWEETIGGTETDDPSEVISKGDGYLITGFSQSGVSGDKTEASYGGWDYWIMEINNQADILWQKTVGGDDWDICYSMDRTEDGGIVLGGSSASGISGDKSEADIGNGDYWIVKLGPELVTSIQEPTVDLPNRWRYELYSSNGQLVSNGVENKGSQIDWYSLPLGVYLKKYLDTETEKVLKSERLLLGDE